MYKAVKWETPFPGIQHSAQPQRVRRQALCPMPPLSAEAQTVMNASDVNTALYGFTYKTTLAYVLALTSDACRVGRGLIESDDRCVEGLWKT